MRIKSFYADSMDTALQCASKEMGEEALILNTREAPYEFRHFGKYEVVCACAQEKEEKAAAIQEPPPPTIQAAENSTKVIAIVGPNGVGKSTACVKIAIQAKLELGLSVAVLTWDTARIGSVETLRAYCEIASIPFKEIDSAEGFEAALRSLPTTQLCVVDTPSIASKNSDDSISIAQALTGRSDTEIHLVVSSAHSSDYLKSVINRYSAFQPGFLLPTHLDDSQLDLSSDEMDCLKGLRIKWCSTGPSVPEDLADSAALFEKAGAPAQKPTTKIEKILMRYRKGDFDSTPAARRQSAA